MDNVFGVIGWVFGDGVFDWNIGIVVDNINALYGAFDVFIHVSIKGWVNVFLDFVFVFIISICIQYTSQKIKSVCT